MGTARLHRGFYCLVKFSLTRTSSPAAVPLPFICIYHHAAGTFKAVLAPTLFCLFPLNCSEPSFYFHALIQVPRRKYLLLLSYRLPHPPWLVFSLISLRLRTAPELTCCTLSSKARQQQLLLRSLTYVLAKTV